VAGFPRIALYLRMNRPPGVAVTTSLIQAGGIFMRVAVTATAVCLSIVGLAAAAGTEAAIRAPTNIPAQRLDSALRTFARQRGLVMAYRSEVVGERQTEGASGDLTLDEALTRLLSGSGLAFKFLDERTITIVRLTTAPAMRDGTTAELPGDDSRAGGSSLRSYWDRLRLAQADQGQPAGATGLEGGSSGHGEQHKSVPAAASGADADNGLQEVVVTARYRAESLQQTPISITALTGADIEARGITNIGDLAMSIPNTTLVKEGSTGGSTLVAYIRGIGQANYSLAFQPGVPIYVDDIYQPTAFGSFMTLGDVERVDVLRGPQGTLFGKNSEGGAVSIHSVDPKGDNTGFFEAAAGDYAERRFRGAFDTALIPDRLFLRVAGGSEDRDGYVTRYDYACLFPTQSGTLKPTVSGNCRAGTAGGVNDTYGRIALKWLVTDDLTVRLSATTTKDDDQAVPEVPLYINANNPGLAPYNARVAVPLTGVPISSRFVAPNPYVDYSTFSDPINGAVLPSDSPQQSWDVTGKVDWNLPYGLHFTSISGFHHFDGQIPESRLDPIPNSMILGEWDYSSYSEEERLSGTLFHDKLEWTAGIYYYYGSGDQDATVDLPTTVVGSFIGLDEATHFPTSNSNESGYLHGLYHLTEQLGLEAGLRYSHDEFHWAYQGTYLAQTPANPIFAPGSPAFGAHQPLDVLSKDSRWDPKVALQYQWTPNFMTYAQYATGFKGGGTNPSPTSIAAATPFSIEQLKAYEIGAKTELFERRVTLDVAAFQNDVTGMQLIGYGATTLGGAVTLNAGQAIIRGAEAEIQARPLPALLLNTSVGYMHFRYASLGEAAESATNPSGLVLNDVAPFSPTLKGNFGVQYSFGLGRFGSLTPRLDYSYQSRVYFDPQNALQSSQGGYGLANGRLSWEDADGKFSTTLEVNNIFNKLYYWSMFNSLRTAGLLTGQPAPPRSGMLSVRYAF
jgi:iron complex outermembrane recepter protein